MSHLGVTSPEQLMKELREEGIGREIVDRWANAGPVDHLARLESQLRPGETLYISVSGYFSLSVATMVSLTSLEADAYYVDHMKPPESIHAYALTESEHQLALSVLTATGYYLLGGHFSEQPGIYTALAENTSSEAALAAMGSVVEGASEGPTGYVVARLDKRSSGYLVLDWRPVSVAKGSYVTDQPVDAPTHMTISALE
jgi:hypothetical protein